MRPSKLCRPDGRSVVPSQGNARTARPRQERVEPHIVHCSKALISMRPLRSSIIASLHATVARLAALRKQQLASNVAETAHLTRFDGFGSNPGALGAWLHVPKGLRKGAPLVVVLHGCTQTANGYDRGAGWSSAADEHGFALLFPEQQRSNNPNLCFNWFSPGDARRGKGEALSIRQMIAAMQARHETDRARVYVTGLSAGGAMAAVMLATYPELFAGGAVIAGLPFGTAHSVPEALERMRGHGLPQPAELARLVRSASGHPGPWPTLSVWHGGADATVDRLNARALLDQWRGLHGLGSVPSRADTVSGYPHRVWADSNGRDLVEDYLITGMGHGTPLAGGAFPAEKPGPYMLEAGISSTREIARFWGLGGKGASVARAPGHRREQAAATLHNDSLETDDHQPSAGGVQKTIENALRAAGLLKR